MTMAALNSQIAHVQNSLYVMTSQLGRNEEAFERLKQAHSQLVAYREEFITHKARCLKPELSTRTWFGQKADDFDTFRTHDLQESYASIIDRQLDDAIERLERHMNTMRQSIDQLRTEIASSQAKLDRLYVQRRKGALS